MAVKNTYGDMAKLQNWFLVLGILFLFFGMQIMIFPVVSTFALEIMFGILLILMGACEVVLSFMSKGWKGFVFLLLGGLLSLLFGALLLFNPLQGVLALTMLLGLFFLVQGALKLVKSIMLKPDYHWEWIFFDGVITVMLGLLVLLAWPSDARWVIGLFFGIDVFFSGLSFLMLSMAAKK